MMCGIFGWLGHQPPDPDLLVAAALAAGHRGPHGVGCYTHTPGGKWAGWRALGATEAHRDRLAAAAAATVLGHTRLATCGNRTDPNQLQPIITAGGDALAHNGVIRNPDVLHPGAATDSLALAAAYQQLRDTGTPAPDALDKLIATADHVSWAVVVVDRDGAMWTHRRHHPLYVHHSGGGVYLCSQPTARGNQLLPEDVAVEVTHA